MRLTKEQHNIIKQTFLKQFKNGDIYLFGSRVDDTQKGGDIDLFIKPTTQLENEYQCKRAFSIELDKKLGEQKIDIVIAKDSTRLIEQVALKNGIKL